MKWLIRLFVILIIVFIALSVKSAKADGPPVTMSVTATGVIVFSPQGFTIVYVDDTHVKAYWQLPSGSDMVELRYKYSDYPSDIGDGQLGYSGNDTNALLNIDLTGTLFGLDTSNITDPVAAVPYFRIWSRANSGVWELIGSRAKGDFMTQSWLLFIMLLYALAVSVVPFIARVFWTNIWTKVFSGLTISAAWVAFIMFLLETPQNGFTFNFTTGWMKILALSILSFTFTFMLVAVGSTIDKTGKLVSKQSDTRTRSQRVQADYTKKLRNRLK